MAEVDQRVRAEKLTQSALRDLALSDQATSVLKKLGAQILKPNGAGDFNRDSVEWYMDLMQRVLRARTLLLKELRAQEKDGRKAGDDVPEDQWPVYIRAWIEKMAPHRRREVLSGMADLIREVGAQ